MEFENYTERARGFVQAAQGLALRSGHQRFTPEHLLKVLLDDKEGLAANLIKVAGGDPARCHRAFAERTQGQVHPVLEADPFGADFAVPIFDLGRVRPGCGVISHGLRSRSRISLIRLED